LPKFGFLEETIFRINFFISSRAESVKVNPALFTL
jgi:hypothetical protein